MALPLLLLALPGTQNRQLTSGQGQIYVHKNNKNRKYIHQKIIDKFHSISTLYKSCHIVMNSINTTKYIKLNVQGIKMISQQLFDSD